MQDVLKRPKPPIHHTFNSETESQAAKQQDHEHQIIDADKSNAKNDLFIFFWSHALGVALECTSAATKDDGGSV